MMNEVNIKLHQLFINWNKQENVWAIKAMYKYMYRIFVFVTIVW